GADDMTLDKCATFCASWPYFGAEYGRECFCGLGIDQNAGGAPAPQAECSFPCAGDSSEICGAGGRMNLYHHPAKSPTNPETMETSVRLGCVTEAPGGRTLGLAATASDAMTLEICDAFCAAYTMWGVEYGRECFCGNELRAGAEMVGIGECDMLCAGNGLQLCGAGNRVMVYTRSA
ncbi:WSC domain-containing protein, partial [Apodospora peruviana]